ncbi:MAG: cysteine hydrolase [Rhodobacterales bacterium]|nr:MAG: cysteine hydrolase [Rhodobacterales bacterium]
MDHTALLIIDMQNDYFEGGKYTLQNIAQAAANAAGILAAFRKRGGAVFHIRHEILRKPAPFFEPGTEGAEIYGLLRPVRNETVITKNFPNSFRDTALHGQLQDLAVKELVITGAMSHYCIDATTRAAVDLGYVCKVAHDACATRDLAFNGISVTAEQVHAGFMAALSMGYASVLPTGKLIEGLSD